MAPKLSLLEAYQKAFNNPLRRYQRQAQQLRNAMRNLIPLDQATEQQRFEGTRGNPNNQGPLGHSRSGGTIGSGTNDRMPGTKPNEKRLKSGKTVNSQYIPTPLDPKFGNKGFI